MKSRHLPLAAVILAHALLATACDHETQTSPTPPSVVAGYILQSPQTVGLAAVTTFTFTAMDFRSIDGGPLKYTWDFGDHSQAVGGATVTHTYTIDRYSFNVMVIATSANGATADSVLWGAVKVRTLTGRWGIRDATGRLLLGATYMSQDGTAVRGEEPTPGCEYTATGAIIAPRSVRLVYTRAGAAPKTCDLPASFTFSGTADDAAYVFAGAMDPGGPASLVVCDEPGECYYGGRSR